MERALALPPRLHLDAKRIAATSVAIVVHAAVLMLLLMPTTTRDTPAVVEQPLIVVPVIPVTPIRPPPPPPHEPIHRVVEQAPRVPVVAPNPPQPDAVDDTPSPVDTYVPPQVDAPATDFSAVSTAPVFEQISADVAPVPPYPLQALRRRIAGDVVLRIRVDARGNPVEVTIESSSGSSLLDEAAAKFVRARWHFVPAMRDGQPVEALARLPIQFALPR